MEWRGSRVLCDMDFEGIKVCFVWDDQGDKRMKQRVSESSQVEMARRSRSGKSLVIASVVTGS